MPDAQHTRAASNPPSQKSPHTHRNTRTQSLHTHSHTHHTHNARTELLRRSFIFLAILPGSVVRTSSPPICFFVMLRYSLGEVTGRHGVCVCLIVVAVVREWGLCMYASFAMWHARCVCLCMHAPCRPTPKTTDIQTYVDVHRHAGFDTDPNPITTPTHVRRHSSPCRLARQRRPGRWRERRRSGPSLL